MQYTKLQKSSSKIYRVWHAIKRLFYCSCSCWYNVKLSTLLTSYDMRGIVIGFVQLRKTFNYTSGSRIWNNYFGGLWNRFWTLRKVYWHKESFHPLISLSFPLELVNQGDTLSKIMSSTNLSLLSIFLRKQRTCQLIIV